MLAAGGGNGEPALNHCLQQLREIPGYTVHSCEAAAHPLPADRTRILKLLPFSFGVSNFSSFRSLLETRAPALNFQEPLLDLLESQ